MGKTYERQMITHEFDDNSYSSIMILFFVGGLRKKHRNL